jgi:hypothetical protein
MKKISRVFLLINLTVLAGCSPSMQEACTGKTGDALTLCIADYQSRQRSVQEAMRAAERANPVNRAVTCQNVPVGGMVQTRCY